MPSVMAIYSYLLLILFSFLLVVFGKYFILTQETCLHSVQSTKENDMDRGILHLFFITQTLLWANWAWYQCIRIRKIAIVCKVGLFKLQIEFRKKLPLVNK